LWVNECNKLCRVESLKSFSSVTSKEILCLLWNPEVYCCHHNLHWTTGYEAVESSPITPFL
jgi:hypothetical protein